VPRICCLDLDTFFVSVERLLDPSLEGKPVVVGAMPGNRGVVTACSYEVRAFGVRSGMPINEAVRLAPDAIYLPGRFSSYSPYSKKVRAILERYTPEVKAASIDEFYMDFSGCERLYARPDDADGDATIERVINEMRAAVKEELGLPCSAGVGISRTIAKVASGRAKPAGTWMVRRGQERDFLAPLPVRKLPGIGPVTETKLEADGLRYLGQLMNLAAGPQRARWRRLAERIERCCEPSRVKARDRPAFREHDPTGLTVGSISNERTFSADVGDEDAIAEQLLKLSERVCHRARKRDIRARTVTLKLRYSDFQTLTRSRTIHPTNAEAAVHATIRQLYAAARTRNVSVRLLGVGLSNLVGPDKQLALPFGKSGRPKMGKALDAIRERYGYEAVRLGSARGRDSWLA
jgi:DNA polymerase IV